MIHVEHVDTGPQPSPPSLVYLTPEPEPEPDCGEEPCDPDDQTEFKSTCGCMRPHGAGDLLPLLRPFYNLAPERLDRSRKPP